MKWTGCILHMSDNEASIQVGTKQQAITSQCNANNLQLNRAKSFAPAT